MDARINGLRMHYIDTGNPAGLPVVLIHGFPFSYEMWRPQIEEFSRDYRVIAYDVRGHGKSDAGDAQYTIDFFVDDLVALLDHLKIGKAVVCGLSMGGYIALRAVERHSDRIHALVLADTRAEADTNEAKSKRANQMQAIVKIGVAAFAEDLVKAVFAPSSLRLKNEEVTMIREIIEATEPRVLRATLLALAARTDSTHVLGQIAQPVLVIAGEQDTITPVEAAEKLNKQIRGARLAVISKAGHLSSLENPSEFNAALGSFLRSLAK